MLVFPNAKINIGLYIVEKRADGYHNIESCFYPVPWKDALEIVPADEFSMVLAGIDIPGNSSDNLCAKAFKMMAADFDLSPVQMHLLKCVPIGAGLGGGSADAAFAIKALDHFFSLDLSLEKQLDYARRLGSDCAFFIGNKAAYCFGKGDEFESIELDLAGKWIALVNPGIHISTVEAYSGITPKRSPVNLRTVLKEPVSAWREVVTNDFEATLFPKYPLLPEIKQKLYNAGASYAAMSGSGSTVYGIFENEADIASQFPGYKVWQGFL